MELIKKLKFIFNHRQKLQLILLTVAIVMGALLELIGISAILPFINVIMDMNYIHTNKYLSYFYNIFNMKNNIQFCVFLSVVLILLYLLKNVYLVFMNYYLYKFTNYSQKQLSIKMLKCYMNQPYSFHLSKNIAELQLKIQTDAVSFFNAVLAFLQLCTEVCVCIALFVLLLFTDVCVTLFVTVIMLMFIYLFMNKFKKVFHQSGEENRVSGVQLNKWTQQSFGGIKETKILRREQFFVKEYSMAYDKYAMIVTNYQTISYINKPILETLSVGCLLSVIIMKLLNGGNVEEFFSILTVIAVAAVRMLPSFNRITNYLSVISYQKSAINSVYHDLYEIQHLEKEDHVLETAKIEVDFKSEIRLENISFKYPGTEKYILNGINLKIEKGTSIAFVGTSGTGKTTLADVILGILEPEYGSILVDEISVNENIHSWQSKLGYIPQNIYLIDDTIKNNIAFGIEEKDINEEQLQRAVSESQLKEFIESLDKGIYTEIGERGVRLSGGQRQRIGIARALYNNPDILILDEATSALDKDTEFAVMDAIDKLKGVKTLIIIAHRLSTIEKCDHIYEIKNGKIIEKI